MISVVYWRSTIGILLSFTDFRIVYEFVVYNLSLHEDICNCERFLLIVMVSLGTHTGWCKKRGHSISLQIFWKFNDWIAWKLVNFCNIICWTQSLTFCLKILSRCGATWRKHSYCVILKSICTMWINDSNCVFARWRHSAMKFLNKKLKTVFSI